MVESVRSLMPAAILLSVLLASCGPKPHLNTDAPYWKDNDAEPMPEPEFDEPSRIWIAFKRTGPDQLLELLDLDRNVRKLTGRATPAKNTNSYDEVPNSTWFTNRHGYPATQLTPQEIKTGLTKTNGPDTSAVWKVFRPKVGGATPGFWIEDVHGDQYLIKFDPPKNPEMATAAAAMASRYFYACGYYVPQETIVYWRPDMLEIREGATFKQSGSRRSLTLEDIHAILSDVRREPDGRIRSLASLSLGNVKGPFMYEGVNKKDPNDWCPHQHRRELRGLQVIGSLVSHYDLKDHNTMNVYVGDPDEGHLVHHLLDFGSTFGSDGKEAKSHRKGYANQFDLRDVLVSTASLGLKTWSWELAQAEKYPSIGYFESEIFQPSKFDPIIPNPAFEQMTDQDGYWGAKIVTAFRDSDLKALVDAGQFSDPDAAAFLLETLKIRRDKIGRYWFRKVNPIDHPRLTSTRHEVKIEFDDLWIKSGLGTTSAHSFTIRHQGKTIIEKRPTVGETVLISDSDIALLNQAKIGCFGVEKCYLFEVLIYSERDGNSWKKPVIFTLYWGDSADQSRIVGIRHPG